MKKSHDALYTSRKRDMAHLKCVIGPGHMGRGPPPPQLGGSRVALRGWPAGGGGEVADQPGGLRAHWPQPSASPIYQHFLLYINLSFLIWCG